MEAVRGIDYLTKRGDEVEAGDRLRTVRGGVRQTAGGRTAYLGDQFFLWLTRFLALAILALLSLIFYEVIVASKPSLQRFGFGFLTSTEWDPVAERFGALPFIFGTVASSLIALILAVPLSLAVATFLVELAPWWLRGPAGVAVELLAAIPSVVYGLWGIFVLVPFLRSTVEPPLIRSLGFLPLFRGPAIGVGLLAAGVILAIMITPIITAVIREVLLTVPRHQREAMLALGATRWETIRLVVLPYGRAGILGGVILGLGRALGETMAVTMVIGNRPEIALSLFAPAYSMASVIANEFTEATSAIHLSALVEIALILFLVTILINILARLLIWRVSRAVPGAVRE